MEDPRLSRMYAKLLRQKMSHMRHNLHRIATEHSGLLTITVVILLLLGVGIGLKERGRGTLHRLKTALKVNP
ncbi:MAG TPA: hypothetical protein VFE38_16765, partial [Edaphobacter sp.]|nr:hypothetical protein [Edaphobacter sp.]